MEKATEADISAKATEADIPAEAINGLLTYNTYEYYHGLLMQETDRESILFVPSAILRIMGRHGSKIVREFNNLPYFSYEIMSLKRCLATANERDLRELLYNGFIQCNKKDRVILERALLVKIRAPKINIPRSEKSTSVLIKGRHLTIHHLTDSAEEPLITFIPVPPFPLDGLINNVGMSKNGLARLFQVSMGSFISNDGNGYYHNVDPFVPTDLLGMSIDITEFNEKDVLSPWTLVIKSYVKGLDEFTKGEGLRIRPELETIGKGVWNLSAKNYIHSKDNIKRTIMHIAKYITTVHVLIRVPESTIYDRTIKELKDKKKA